MTRPAARRTRSVPIEPLERRAYLAATVAAVTFAPAVSFPAGLAPVAIAAADLNGDGHVDLAVADATAEDVAVFYGTATGTTFTVGPVLRLSAPPTALLAVDLNGDGVADLAVAASPGAANGGTTVTTFLNAGNGTFGPAQQQTVGTAAGSDEPVAMAAADVNADGHEDLVVTDYSTSAVSVLLGTGAGTFAAPVVFNVASTPTAVAVADFNGDGHPDIAVTGILSADTGTAAPGGGNADGVLVLDGGGNGQFTAGSVTALPAAGSTRLAVADVNADGHPDLIVGNADATASVLTNDGAGNFTLAADPTTAAGSTGIAAADLNLDGNPDLVTADGGTVFSSGADSVTVIPGTGNGTVAAATATNVGSLPAALVVADLNGDGRPDVATANEGSGTVAVLLNTTPVTPVATTTTLAVTPTTGPAGSPVVLTATVAARSVSPLTSEPAPTGAVTFYDGGTALGTATVATTAGATTAALTTAVLTTTTLGVASHRLSAKYAGDGGYATSGSAAVTAVVAATATSGPDLVPSFVSVGLGPTIAPGQAGTVKVRLTNRGNATAVGRVTDDLFLSLDGTVDATDTAVPVAGTLATTGVRLAAGASTVVTGRFTVPPATPAGSYVLLVRADANGAVAQSGAAANDVAASPTAYTVADQFGTVGGVRNVTLSATDAVGQTATTFSLRGPGQGTVTVGDAGADLLLTGTTAATVVMVTPARGAAFALHDLTADTVVGRVVAPGVSVTHAVLLAGGANAASLGDLSGATLTAPTGIRTLTVSRWASGSLTSGAIGTFRDAGDMGAAAAIGGAVNTVVIGGGLSAAFDVTGPRLGSIRIQNGIAAAVTVTGALGSVATYGTVGSGILFLADPLPRRAILGGAAVTPASDRRFILYTGTGVLRPLFR